MTIIQYDPTNEPECAECGRMMSFFPASLNEIKKRGFAIITCCNSACSQNARGFRLPIKITELIEATSADLKS